MPDPGTLFDYNRYLYTRGNPMRYTDPTGHCAKAQPDVSDQEAYAEWLNCGQMVDTILAQWDTTPNYWNSLYTSKEVFEKEVAWNPNNHADLFNTNFLNSRQSDEYQAKAGGAPAPSYPDDGLGCGGDRACQALVRNALKCHTGEVDCVGIANDVVGVATTVSIAAACIPGFAVCGTIAAIGAPVSAISTVGGVGWTSYRWWNGKSSTTDLIVTGMTAVAGTATGGLAQAGALTSDLLDLQAAYSIFQLIYDIAPRE